MENAKRRTSFGLSAVCEYLVVREFDTAPKGKIAVLHLQICISKSRRLGSKKPRQNRGFAEHIFFMFLLWRRGRDSNPRSVISGTHDFQSCALDQLSHLSIRAVQLTSDIIAHPNPFVKGIFRFFSKKRRSDYVRRIWRRNSPTAPRAAAAVQPSTHPICGATAAQSPRSTARSNSTA